MKTPDGDHLYSVYVDQYCDLSIQMCWYKCSWSQGPPIFMIQLDGHRPGYNVLLLANINGICAL